MSGSCTCTNLLIGTLCYVANCVIPHQHLLQGAFCYILNFNGRWYGTEHLMAGFATGYTPIP